MQDIVIREVQNRRDMRRFHLFPYQIYQNDPNWVPPFFRDRMKQTDPKRGLFFERGEASCFIATSENRMVGTICAAVDPPTNTRRGTEDCLFGFFESIDDLRVARALFDAAAAWGARHGLKDLYGPFNLDYENGYGVLISGRDRPPALMCGHTPAYYVALFDAYGFAKARGDQLAFAAAVDPELASRKRLFRLADIVVSRSPVTVRGVDLSRWDEEVDTIHSLLVKSLAHMPASVPWRRDVLEHTLRPFKTIADPELVLFGEYEGTPVGWFPGMPNLNELFIRLHGLKRPWDYLTLAAGMKRQTECLSVKSVLVLPEYWNTGVAIVMFSEMAKRAQAKGYRWIDLSLTNEENAQTPVIAERLDAEEYKRYRIYRKPIGQP